ncbi:DUF2303 family protein [Peterkaempfera sp. SMS 1(5)a]|uniref:DUF2303 family protein n=1 Tax=Peterkaempfera podocarpi TaxID=3232308 RepID=UPI0036701D66
MTSYSTEPATLDGTQAVIDIAQQAIAPVALETGHVYAVRGPGGTTITVDLVDKYRTAPARKTGTTTVRDSDSFLAYWTKHHDDGTEIYADTETLTITAVLDAHEADSPRFGQHRLNLALRRTDTWDQWLRNDGRFLDQETFASFLEDHRGDLLQPDSATMLEVAQSIQGATKCTFQSGHRLQSGERQLAYVEETTAKAGAKGTLTIPEVFTIGLVPFEGAAGYKLTALFKYRISRDGSLSLGYKLDKPADTLRTAFADVRQQVVGAVTSPVLNGTPA